MPCRLPTVGGYDFAPRATLNRGRHFANQKETLRIAIVVTSLNGRSESDLAPFRRKSPLPFGRGGTPPAITNSLLSCLPSGALRNLLLFPPSGTLRGLRRKPQVSRT